MASSPICSRPCPSLKRSCRNNMPLDTKTAPKKESRTMIQKIGVIGAGQMGNGIAHVSALAGYEVKLADVDKAQLDKALSAIEQNMGRQIKRGVISKAQRDAALKRITTGQNFSIFADCDLVIEAAVE